ncbi:MAG: dTDP-4-dehydrorhamnose 3,5-epimerase [Gemmatimonadota bacterium]
MNFTVEPQTIRDVLLIRRQRFEDRRGFFSELFRRSRFSALGLETEFAQDNLAHSRRNVLRGLHFQRPPAAQGKLVTVTRGRIYDVAVDLRRREPTYRRWVAAELSGEGGEMLWIPPGFAHGYLALSDEVEVYYKVTTEYDPKLDAGVRWNDPDLGIVWPVPEPVLSERDRALPLLREMENPF